MLRSFIKATVFFLFRYHRDGWGNFRLRNGYIFIRNDDKDIGDAVLGMIGNNGAHRRPEFLDLLVKLSLGGSFLTEKAVIDRASASALGNVRNKERIGRARERARARRREREGEKKKKRRRENRMESAKE